MKNILTVRGLHASIEGKEILRGIDFTVNAGEVHAIMGPNGSGKSTILKTITRHLVPLAGAVELAEDAELLLQGLCIQLDLVKADHVVRKAAE